jgi:hypothetical protein
MRGRSWFVLLLSLPAVACGGADLTLPGPGDPAALTIVGGDDQRGTLGEPLSEPLVVQLVDGAGTPVGGRDVVFRFTDDLPDAAVEPGQAPTDTAGRASVRARLGRREGLQAIEALVTAPGEDLRVRFRLTAEGPEVEGPPPPENGGNGGNGGGGGGSGGGGGGDDGGGVGSGGGGGGGGGGGAGGGGGGSDDGDGGGGGSDDGGGGGGNGHGNGGGHGGGKGGGHGGQGKD